MLIYDLACSAVLLLHVRHTLQKWSDQLWNSDIVVIRHRNTEILPKNRNTREKYRNTCEDTNTGLIKKCIYSEDYLEKPRAQFPYSPKSVSFPCSLRRLIWVYSVCIGISDPMFRFFKFLVRASFVCISDEKMLYKINLFFSRRGFPPRFHVTYRLEHVVS